MRRRRGRVDTATGDGDDQVLFGVLLVVILEGDHITGDLDGGSVDFLEVRGNFAGLQIQGTQEAPLYGDGSCGGLGISCDEGLESWILKESEAGERKGKEAPALDVLHDLSLTRAPLDRHQVAGSGQGKREKEAFGGVAEEFKLGLAARA